MQQGHIWTVNLTWRNLLFFFFTPGKAFAQAQMSELFNLGTETSTVVLRACGTQTATEMTSYHFFHFIFFNFLNVYPINSSKHFCFECLHSDLYPVNSSKLLVKWTTFGFKGFKNSSTKVKSETVSNEFPDMANSQHFQKRSKVVFLLLITAQTVSHKACRHMMPDRWMFM